MFPWQLQFASRIQNEKLKMWYLAIQENIQRLINNNNNSNSKNKNRNKQFFVLEAGGQSTPSLVLKDVYLGID